MNPLISRKILQKINIRNKSNEKIHKNGVDLKCLMKLKIKKH